MAHVRLWLASVALVAAPVAVAQGTVWKCVESDGRAHYTNIKRDTEGRNCTVVTKEVSVVPAPTVKPVAAQPETSAAAASFPRVDRERQRARDEGRRQILQDELTTEERSLADARAKLAEQEAVRYGDERNYQRVLDRLQPYKEAVERHERNITALKREISNLR